MLGVSYYGIKYDSKRVAQAFKIHLMATVKNIQQELLLDAKQGMNAEGANDLFAGAITEVAGIITATICGGPYALMSEHGTGSLLDESNPALAAYKASNMWNPARRDNRIRSRPNAPGQIDIFGKPVRGRGKGGVDLEKAGVVEAQYPSHAVQIAFRWMAQERFRWYLQRALDTFPWGKYLKVTNTKG